MIAFLQGQVLQHGTASMIINVAGVGYEVRPTARAAALGKIGSQIRVYTYHHVREDAHTLFAFADIEERNMFQQLLEVNGVGPKTALALVSAFGPVDIVRAVQQGDAAALKTPGVGPKIIKRIITELQPIFGEAVGKSVAGTAGAGIRQDVAAALVQLGYSEREIDLLLQQVDMSGLSVEAALKKVLQTAQR